MAERKRLAGSKGAFTNYRDAAIASISLETGGRFNNAAVVTGSTPSAQYPRLSSGPWAEPADIVGIEPPTGIDINAQEAVGEAFEIEANIQAELAKATLVSSSSGDAAPETVAPPSADAAPLSSRGSGAPFKLRRL
jgi:hypothetical protein